MTAVLRKPDRSYLMVESEIKIRCFRSEDSASLCSIWYAASRSSHSFLPEALLLAQMEQIAEKFLPETEVWVAESDVGILGFIGLMDHFIGGLFIAPQAQGKGIGGRLLDHAMQRKGRLALEVYAANRRAVAFYRRKGFCGVRRRAIDDNGLPFPLILMQRGMTTPNGQRHRQTTMATDTRPLSAC